VLAVLVAIYRVLSVVGAFMLSPEDV
jgi:hypothetical protein